MASRALVRLIFPHQLFAAHLEAPKTTVMVLVEEDLFFRQYPFHKQKLILHRASMSHFADKLYDAGYKVELIETSPRSKSSNSLTTFLKRFAPESVSYYDLVDDWLQREVDEIISKLQLKTQRLVSPGFLTSPGQIDEYFDNNANRMQYFYEWQRKRLNILVEKGKPVGGKWSFDTANRKRLPKNIALPPEYSVANSPLVREAKSWVEKAFAENPGSSELFSYPITSEQAKDQLREFISQRLALFGPYEDAIAIDQGQLFHSVLSAPLNIGLITPQEVVGEVLDYAGEHNVPIESLEGFIRQIIGWREYMRATYVTFGREMRSGNYLQFDRKLANSWWDGSTGLTPVDTVIKRVLNTAYAHHIERLMVLGNAMVLLRIDPDEVYRWFMSLFIDAYDWVMVPNIYAMSQFAAKDMITTKPYISGSNYLRKMSDFATGDWEENWDALYWQFVRDHREMIQENYRMRMVVNLYDRFDDKKKSRLKKIAADWLR